MLHLANFVYVTKLLQLLGVCPNKNKRDYCVVEPLFGTLSEKDNLRMKTNSGPIPGSTKSAISVFSGHINNAMPQLMPK